MVSVSTKTKYKKVIVSGDVIEVYEMDYAPFSGDKSGHNDDFDPFDYQEKKDRESQQLTFSDLEIFDMRYERRIKKQKEDEIDRVKERRLQTSRDTRNRIRRLALNNFSHESRFITLTFKDNVIDIDYANKEFKKFIQRLRSRFGNFKYITVIEFQKRGAVHYHMLTDLKYVQANLLWALWQNRKVTRNKDSDFYCVGDEVDTKQGFIKINKVRHVDNIGAYLVKYMIKNAGDDRLKGRKMYLCSKGLRKSFEYKGLSADIVIDSYLKDKKEVYTNSYFSEHLGVITYKEYNLKR